LQDECRVEDDDPDNLEFDYETLRKAREEYLTLQISYLSTVTTEDYLKMEGEEHNTVRNEFNAALKLAKKAIKKSRSKDTPNISRI